MRPPIPSPRAVLAAVLAVAVLAGCGSPEERADADPLAIPDAVPRVEPRARYGNPPSYVVFGQRYVTQTTSDGHVERGLASWYGKQFHGRRTSSGEPYDMYAMTAAHRTLPLPSYVRVTNLENGRSAVVRVNDRGPFHGARVIDLSYSAARKLGVVDKGTAMVEVRAIDPRRPDRGGGPVPVARRAPVGDAGDTSGTGPAGGAARRASARGGEPGGRWFLQVGAFSEHANAERLHARLMESLSGSQRVSLVRLGDASPYKVRVGPLASEAELHAVSERLRGLGVGAGHRVQD
jgi:rare lipoprotein A